MKKSDPIDRIPISAIKQYVYCKRRFALMHIDCQWSSNYKTIEGDFLHQKVDDPFFQEKRRGVYKSRSVPVYSERLNIYGIADIIEFTQDEKGVLIGSKAGLWRITPIEYKNGRPEKSKADNFQLGAIALCLEEMFLTSIYIGYIYYGKLRKRIEVTLSDSFKKEITATISEMNNMIINHTIPPKPQNQNCSLCSLVDICMPNIFKNNIRCQKSIKQLMKKG